MRCTHGSNTFRLAGGSHNYGRVEVLVRGQWGIICDQTWDILDANVVCHQLGFIKGAKHAQRGEQYGRSSGTFHRDHVYCEGSEKDVLDCPYGTYHHCYHFEYASVVCNTRLFTDIRKPSNTAVSDVLLPVIVTQIIVINVSLCDSNTRSHHAICCFKYQDAISKYTDKLNVRNFV